MTDVVPNTVNVDTAVYDAIVIGAGVAGLYQIHRLKQAKKNFLALEAGSGVGGVWHWNRYPGARLDSESYSYAYGFSQDLLAEWSWSEHFASQPEMERYYNFVADRFGLRDHIRFNSQVQSAHFDEQRGIWNVTTSNGDRFVCRFLIAAVGPLTAPSYPNIPGREDFAGECHHTSRWPDKPIAFEGKRIGVVGTGATGVQVIQEVAKHAKELVVFQRTPNYCAPLNNQAISEDQMRDLRDRLPELIAFCRSNYSWFLHDPEPRSVFDLTPEERTAFLERKYAEMGLGIWRGNFYDIFFSEDANKIVSDFMREKIRSRVKDPETADRLVPKTFGFATRRVPLETGYYEVYNQPNVRLVDIAEDPIKRITPAGVRTGTESFDLDILIFATGFDALAGSFDRIDITGAGGAKLKDKWADGIEDFLGVHVCGFPNFFMPGGPLASTGNFGPAVEYSVDWVMELIRFMDESGYQRIDCKPEAEQRFMEVVRTESEKLLMSKVKSWMTGYNSNVASRSKISPVLFTGTAVTYRELCAEAKSGDYSSFDFE